MYIDDMFYIQPFLGSNECNKYKYTYKYIPISDAGGQCETKQHHGREDAYHFGART
jgi:hypothetical protein